MNKLCKAVVSVTLLCALMLTGCEVQIGGFKISTSSSVGTDDTDDTAETEETEETEVKITRRHFDDTADTEETEEAEDIDDSTASVDNSEGFEDTADIDKLFGDYDNTTQESNSKGTVDTVDAVDADNVVMKPYDIYAAFSDSAEYQVGFCTSQYDKDTGVINAIDFINNNDDADAHYLITVMEFSSQDYLDSMWETGMKNLKGKADTEGQFKETDMKAFYTATEKNIYALRSYNQSYLLVQMSFYPKYEDEALKAASEIGADFYTSASSSTSSVSNTDNLLSMADILTDEIRQTCKIQETEEEFYLSASEHVTVISNGRHSYVDIVLYDDVSLSEVVFVLLPESLAREDRVQSQRAGTAVDGTQIIQLSTQDSEHDVSILFLKEADSNVFYILTFLDGYENEAEELLSKFGYDFNAYWNTVDKYEAGDSVDW